MNIFAQNAANPHPPRLLTLRIRLSVLIGAVMLLLTGVICIFILGVIMGRGYNVQEKIGVLAQALPGPPESVSNAESSGWPESRHSSVATGETGKADAADLDELFKNDSLLKGEELRFKDNLKTPYTQAGADESGFAQPARTAAEAAGGIAASSAPFTATAGNVRAGDPVYEYVFQVSSLNQLNQAEALVQKLKAGGHDSRVEIYRTAQKTWYRVIVTFKGRAADLEAFKTQLKRFNINEAVLHGRKAVSG
jgi:cell division septation protein DedD